MSMNNVGGLAGEVTGIQWVRRGTIRTGMPVTAMVGLGLMVFGCAGAAKDKPPLSVVDSVNLDRYLGTWYEIASYPAWFQKGCTGSTAEYTLLPDGKIQVVNRCRKDSLDGPLKEAKGKAEIVDTTTNAKLRVWFFWPLKGNYWIIDLDRDYQWAVVGEPSRKYLWILSRTPTMKEIVYHDILARLPQKGYDRELLRRTVHVDEAKGNESGHSKENWKGDRR